MLQSLAKCSFQALNARVATDLGAQMPDYDFGSMSWRSFEQLVQAIALAEGGSLVTVFGDGRDGGREATFEGPSNFGTSEIKWTGYGVIQAKFRQRDVGDRTSATAWALKELRKEIKDYRDPKKARKKPEYFIFATNVTLSSVGQSGGKDRVSQALKDWADQIGLKGFQIWDGVQIAAYLNVHAGIRQTFAAWTTPGDALAAIVAQIEGSRPDFARVAAQYLQKEFRRDQFAKLQQAGHLNHDPVPLANVFVDLPIQNAPNDQGRGIRAGQSVRTGWFVEELLRESCIPIQRASEGNAVEDGTEKLSREGRTVLLGGPGQGKTTVGQYACQLFRASLLDSMDQNLLEPNIRDGCRSLIDQWPGSLREDSCVRFPIRIVLSDYATKLSDDPALTVIGHIADLFNMRTEAGLAPSDVSRFLRNYPFLMVFDGLDEVPASSNRDRLLETIGDFEIDVSAHGMDAYILVTTRPQGYNDALSPKHYRHLTLSPLDPAVALQYGTKLTESRHFADRDRIDTIVSRLAEAASQESTSRLMESPLQITIMAFLVDQFGRPPDERWDLFHQYYELICRREIERDIASSYVIRELKPRIDTVHRMVGLLLQSESERSGGTRSKLTLQEFRHVVESVLTTEGFEAARLEEATNQIQLAAADRLVFLVGLEDGEVGFEVRSLQEFMAGEALLEANDALAERRLRQIAGNETWRNTFLFAAGKCFKERQYFRPTLIQICTELNDDSSDRPSQLILNGSRLAISLLQEGSARRSPIFAIQLSRIALRLLDSPMEFQGVALAHACNIDTLEVYREFLLPRLRSSAIGNTAQAWACWTELADRGFITFDEWKKPTEQNALLLHSPLFWSAVTTTDSPQIVDKLVKSLELQPPGTILDMFDEVEESDEELPRCLVHNELWPDYLRVLIPFLVEMNPLGRAGLRLVGGPFFYTKSLKPQSDDVYDLVEVSERAHAGWHAVEKALRFNNRPSAQTLASLLHEFAEAESASILMRMTYVMAWPAAASLRFCSSRSEMRALALRVEAGDLGDHEDWLRSETAWQNGSNSLLDLLNNAPTDLPFTAEDSRWVSLISPIAATYGSARTQSFDPNGLAACVEALGTIEHPTVQGIASEIVARTYIPSMRELESKPDLRDLCWKAARDMVARCPSSLNRVAASLVGAYSTDNSSTLSSDLIVEMADLLLASPASYHWRQRILSPGIDDAPLRRGLAKDPRRTGLLVALSYCASHSENFAPFDIDTYASIIEPAPQSLPERCILLIRARLGMLRTIDREIVVRNISADHSLLGALTSASWHNRTLPTIEDFLVSLYDIARISDNSEVSQAIVFEIDECVGLRSTVLSTLEGWVALGFPEALFQRSTKPPVQS